MRGSVPKVQESAAGSNSNLLEILVIEKNEAAARADKAAEALPK